MGKLQITGVDPAGTAKLESLWKLKPGNTFSADYLNDYVRQISPLIPRTASIKTSSHVDQQAKTVDVTLQFSPRATSQ